MTDTLDININLGDAEQKFSSIQEASQTIASTLKDAGSSVMDFLPDVKSYLLDTAAAISNSFNRMAEIEKAFGDNKYNNNYEREMASNEYSFLQRSISAQMQDVAQIRNLSKSLSHSQEMISALSTVMPQIYSLVNSASGVFKGTKLGTDRQIVSQMRLMDNYKNLLQQTGLQDNIAMQNFLQYALITKGSQTSRGSFINHMGGVSGDKHLYQSFVDMIPRGFKNLEFTDTPKQTRAFEASDRKQLNDKELETLYQLIQTNAYAASAAERAGIMRRNNGYFELRDKVTRGAVNAMGGYMMPDFIRAAKGMPMYGIEDATSPDSWEKIARKSSKRFLGGLNAMRTMSDNFDWLNAANYEKMDALRSHFHQGEKIGFSPETNQYQVMRYKLGADGTVQKADPFAIEESLYLNTVMKHGRSKGIKPHNSMIDDVVYLDIDDRLRDGRLDKATEKRLLDQYASVFESGIASDDPKDPYVITRINAKSGIEFMRKSTVNRLNKMDPTFLTGGLANTEFDTWKDAVSAEEYRNKDATPGKSIKDLFGSKMPKNIAVVDLSDTGLDGASIISNKFVPQGFQARAHGIKSALTTMDIAGLVEAYGGKLQLTGYSEDGQKTLVDITKDTDMIINAKDLKNAGAIYAGQSNAQITSAVLSNLQNYGVYANKTYTDANGPTRWLSAQMAQNLRMTPEEALEFSKAWAKEYRDVGTVTGAADILFGKDDERRAMLLKDPSLLHSPAIQQSIADHHQMMISRMSRGDILLPNGEKAYQAMLAPWMIDAINADLKTNNLWESIPADIRDYLDALTLGKDGALFTKTVAGALGIGRYPADSRSIQKVNNLAKNENFVKFMEKLGLDPNAVYMAPNSPYLAYLQSADFDGDILQLFNADLSAGTLLSNIINRTVEWSRNHSGVTDDKIDKAKAAMVRPMFGDRHRSRNNMHDRAEIMAALAKGGYYMGAPHAAIRNALQMGWDNEAAQAVIDGIVQYDTNSALKHGEFAETSAAEMNVIGKYKPFSEFTAMIDKNRDEQGRIKFEDLAGKNLLNINLPSRNMSSSMRASMLARYAAIQNGIDINAAYPWEEIFDAAHGPVDTSTAFGRMQAALRQVDIGLLTGQFAMPSDITIAQLMALRNNAIEEETKNFDLKRANGELDANQMKRKSKDLATSLVNTYGGNVIANLLDYALTPESLDEVEQNRQMIAQFRKIGMTTILSPDDFIASFLSGDGLENITADTPQMQQFVRRVKASNRLSKLDVFDQEQLAEKVQKLAWSPSMLFELIENPEMWADKRINGNYDEYNNSNFGSRTGSAAHAALAHFMEARMNHKSGPMSDDELKAAQQAAIDFFDRIVSGQEPDVVKFQESELNAMKNSKTSEAQRVKKMRDFMANSLLSVYDDADWEVIGVEQSLGDYADMGGRFSKNTKADVVLKNRQSGAVIDLDWKNYSSTKAVDAAKNNIQQLIYASMIDGWLDQEGLGEKLSGYALVNPLTGKIDAKTLSADDKAAMQGAVASIIEYANANLPGGTDEMDSLDFKQRLSRVSSFAMQALGLDKVMPEAVLRQQQSANINAQLGGNDGTAFGAALMLQDDYQHARAVVKSIIDSSNKALNEGQQTYVNPYNSKFYALDQQESVITSLRNTGYEAQANLLEGDINAARSSMLAMLPNQATKDIAGAQTFLKNIEENMPAFTNAKSGMTAYLQQISEVMTHATDAFDTMQSQVDNNKDKIAQNEAIIKGKQAELQLASNDDRRNQLNEEIDDITKKTEALRAINDLYQKTIDGTNGTDGLKAQSEALIKQRDAFFEKHQGEIPVNAYADPRIARMLAGDTSRYRMSRTQFGPSIIGRSMEYNQKQYEQWAASASNYEQAIAQQSQRRAQLLFQRDVTHAGNEQLQNLDNLQIDQVTADIQGYQSALNQAQDAMKDFSDTKGLGLMSTALMNVSNSLEGLILKLGRQALQKAFKEATSFVQQFDKDMITIQQITGKSRQEMRDVRSSTISQAQELRTSVSNVASARAALYRQGLSDAEVDERTEDIIKFSTVTGQKVTDATKNLTAAIQTGLVSSVSEAMDVMAALGDSAATTAEEISAGMQKAAASAKVAGVSYNELSAMLTIATSETQLGGKQAGTFLQTLFGRMNRVTKEGYYNDEGGETTSINDVEAALKTVNISLRDTKNNFRSSFDVLRDVANIWEGLNDLQKNNVTYAMVGNRNANMFNALMEGMSQDGGKLLDEYLGIAEGSGGTVQSKYEIAIQGIQASLDNLKSTYDGFVETLGASNWVTGFIDFAADIVQGITNINNAGVGIITVIGAIGAAVAALSIKIAVLNAMKDAATGNIMGVVSTIAGLAGAGVALGITGGVGNLLFGDRQTPAEKALEDAKLQASNRGNALDKDTDLARKNIDVINEMITSYSKLGEAEVSSADDMDTVQQAIQNLTVYFPSLRDEIDETSMSLENLGKIAKDAEEAADNMVTEQREKMLDIAEPLIGQAVEDANSELVVATLNELDEMAFTKSESVPDDIALLLDEYKWAKTGLFGNGAKGERYTKLANLVNYYLQNGSAFRGEDAWSGYNTLDELVAKGDEVLLDEEAITKFAQYVNTTPVDEAALIKDKVTDIFTNTLSPLWKNLTGGVEEASQGLLDEYFTQFTSDQWLDKTNIVNFLRSKITSGEDIEDWISPISTFYKYNIGGEHGLGLNDLSDESIQAAYNAATAETVEALAEYINADDSGLDTEKVRQNATINGTNGLKALQNIFDIAGSLTSTSASKGYVNEYAMLYSMLQNADTFDEFANATINVNNLTKLLENDSELQQLINAYGETTNDESMNDLRVALASHLFEKALGAAPDAFAKSMFTAASDIFERGRIANAGFDNLSPEMMSTIAEAYGLSMEAVDEDLYDTFAAQYQSDLTSLFTGWATQISNYLSDHKDEEITSLSTVADSRIQQIVRNAAKLGITYNLDEAGNVYYDASNFNVPRTNPLASTSSVFTTSELGSVARAIYGGASWQDYSSEILQAVAKQYPELGTWLNMSNAQRASTEGIALKFKIETQFAVEGLEDLVNAGDLTSEIAKALETIATLKAGSAVVQSMNSITGDITSTADAYNAYLRLVRGGRVRDADYSTLASFLGVDETYLRGLDGATIASQYGADVRQDSLNMLTYAQTTRGWLPEARRLDFDRMLAEYGLIYNENTSAYNFVPNMNPTQNRQMAALGSTYNPRMDARNALSWYIGEGWTGGYDFLTALQSNSIAGVGQNFVDYILGNNELVDQMSQNDNVLSTLFQFAYGTSNYNGSFLNGEDMGRYVLDAILNGTADQVIIDWDSDEAKSLTEIYGDGIKDTLANAAAFGTEAVPVAKRRELQQQYAQYLFNQLADSGDAYDSGLFNTALGFYGNQADRTSAQGSFFQTANDIIKARKELTAMSNGMKKTDLDALKEYARQFGMAEDEIANLDAGSVNMVIDNLDDFATRFTDTATEVGNMLASSDDPIVQGFATWINNLIAAVIAGTNLENFDFAEALNTATGYGGQLGTSRLRRSIADMANNSSSLSDFYDILMSSYDETQLQTIASDQTLGPILARMFQYDEVGNIMRDSSGAAIPNTTDWPSLQQSLLAASPYFGVDALDMHEAGISQLNEFAGGDIISQLMLASEGKMDFDSQSLLDFIDSTPDIAEWINSIEGGAEALTHLQSKTYSQKKALGELGTALKVDGVKNTSAFGDALDNVVNQMKSSQKSMQDQVKAQSTTLKNMYNAFDLAKAARTAKGKSYGSLDKTTQSILQEATGFSDKNLSEMAQSVYDNFMDQLAAAGDESYTNEARGVINQIIDDMASYFESQGETNARQVAITSFLDLAVDMKTGDIDLAGAWSAISAMISAATAALAAGVVDIGTLTLNFDEDGDALHAYTEFMNGVAGNWNSIVNGITGKTGGGGGGGYKNHDSSGGGGGGGKSDAEKLMQNVKNRIAIADHRIKMAQLQETKYEQMGELGNLNNMIEVENTYQADKRVRLQQGIADLEAQLAKTEKGTDDWQKLYETILQYEEEIDDVNNTIDANTKKIKENRQAILKTHTDLEDMLEEEIKNRIQIQREMLDATVTMQDTIVEAIKQRYQDEWDKWLCPC